MPGGFVLKFIVRCLYNMQYFSNGETCRLLHRQRCFVERHTGAGPQKTFTGVVTGACMNDETKYMYFSLSGRQLQLLLAALLRSMSKLAALGDTINDLQRQEGLELEAVHGVLEKLGEQERSLVKVILSEAQFAVVSIAVKTTRLSLPPNHVLTAEYDELTEVLDARRVSRRTRERDEGSTKGNVKA